MWCFALWCRRCRIHRYIAAPQKYPDKDGHAAKNDTKCFAIYLPISCMFSPEATPLLKASWPPSRTETDRLEDFLPVSTTNPVTSSLRGTLHRVHTILHDLNLTGGWTDSKSHMYSNSNSCQKYECIHMYLTQYFLVPFFTSVGETDPDPHVFGPPGTGSVSQRFGSGSFPFFIKVLSRRLKTEDNVPGVKLLEKNMKNLSCIHKVTEERSRIWIR